MNHIFFDHISGISHRKRCFHWREKMINFEVTGHLGYDAKGSVKIHSSIHEKEVSPTEIRVMVGAIPMNLSNRIQTDSLGLHV